MTAELQDQEVISSEDSKLNLMEQIQQRKEEASKGNQDAFQKQKTDEVHVRQSSRDSEQVGGGSEEEEETYDSEQEYQGKTFQFTLGEETFDLDENAVLEFKADGKPVKMSLKEMRDAAAGGVAVRNRMRSLAEERKRLYEPYKNFSKVAESDPLGALKKVFSAIKQIDPKTEFNQFLKSLGKQAQNLARMSPSERKAFELEKELDETRDNLTEKEKLAKIQEMRQELIDDLGLDDEKIFSYGQSILSNPTLAAGIRSEEDLFDRIGEFADEVQRQQAVVTALHKYNPQLKKNDPLVFELSQILEKNPDFDDRDLDEMAERIITGVKKSKASRVLSKRNRSKAIGGQVPTGKNYSKMTPKEALRAQILEKRKSQQ